jgi:hypothetical protein
MRWVNLYNRTSGTREELPNGVGECPDMGRLSRQPPGYIHAIHFCLLPTAQSDLSAIIAIRSTSIFQASDPTHNRLKMSTESPYECCSNSHPGRG